MIQIEGFASTFNDKDSKGDVLVPGAFTETLLRIPIPMMLWEHKGEPIGQWLTVEEQSKGLFVVGIVENQRVIDRILNGVRGLSIGFEYFQEDALLDAESNTKFLTKVDLPEISIGVVPIQDDAVITKIFNEQGRRLL